MALPNTRTKSNYFYNTIDILLIDGTHFTTKSYFKIPQYNTYYTNHPDGNAHGGAAVIVTQTISHNELPKYEEDFLQATYIPVRTPPYELTVSAVYSPPKYTMKSITTYCFSAHWARDSWREETIIANTPLVVLLLGRELFSLLQEKNYSLTIGNPTYWPTDSTIQPDLSDFLITNEISSTYTDIEPSYDLSSGHSPVIATISTSPINIKPIPRLHNSLTNWNAYRTKLHDAINLHVSLKSCTEVEKATNNFIILLQEEAQQATPTMVFKKML